MPVAVSLLDLVAMPHTLPLWPVDFVALVAKLEEDTTDRAQWAIVAGWLEEQEEHALADAFAWASKRPGVTVAKNPWHFWTFTGLPEPLALGERPDGDSTTLPGAVAILAELIRRAREAVA